MRPQAEYPSNEHRSDAERNDGSSSTSAKDEKLLSALERTARYLEQLGVGVKKTKPVAPPSAWSRTPADVEDARSDVARDSELYAPSKPRVVSPADALARSTYDIPAPGSSRPTEGKTGSFARWIGATKFVNIAGLTVPGLIYVGRRTSFNNVGGASLIDPAKPVAEFGDYQFGAESTRTTYENMSPVCRRAYLDWLVNGRQDSEANALYPLLFFQGLEYRVLAESDTSAFAADVEAIQSALVGLKETYGDRISFVGQNVDALLERIVLSTKPSRLYEEYAAERVPFSMDSCLARVALAQAAADRAPISADLAFAWVAGQGGTVARNPLQRCPDALRAAFRCHFAKHFPNGVQVVPGRYPIMVQYPAVGMLMGSAGRTPAHLQDLRAPAVDPKLILGLQGIFYLAQDDLEAYSRLLGRFPGKEHAAVALLHAPRDTWPSDARLPWQVLSTQADNAGFVVTTYKDFLRFIGLSDAKAELSKQVSAGIQLTATQWGLDIECGVELKQLALHSDEPIVLATKLDLSKTEASLLSLALTSLNVARQVRAEIDADPDAGAAVVEALLAELPMLGDCAAKRLKAVSHLPLGVRLSMTALKRQALGIPDGYRTCVLRATAAAVHTGTTESVASMKGMLKVCRALGLEDDSLYSTAHSRPRSSGSLSASALTRAPSGYPDEAVFPSFSLNEARIAELAAETLTTQRLLGSIFTDSDDSVSNTAIPPVSLYTAAPAVVPRGVLGLDQRHTVVALRLAEKPAWPLAEITVLAKQQGLLLAGLLETLNDAAFDHADGPFFESEDPYEINNDILPFLKL